MTTLHVFWVQVLFLALLCMSSSSLATDEQSLLSFKQSVIDSTGVLSSWNSSLNSLPVCRWTGVKCDNQTSRVIGLNLTSSQLAGSISPGIGGLTFLDILDLSNNLLTGEVPSEIGNCSKLSQIVLSGNNLTGAVPPTLGNLNLLQNLDLANNSLTFGIPTALGNCSALVKLDLSANTLNGFVPPEIGNCSKLRQVVLSGNNLTGAVPPTLGNLNLLQRLHLSDNSFTSGIPTALGNCSALTDLDLSNNHLDGSIPASLENCSQLALLNLAANGLTGPIPSSLGNLVKLSRLLLSSNSLTGGFPNLFNLTQNLGDVEMSKNLLEGSLPDEFSQFRLLSILDLSYNNFVGDIPISLGHCKTLISLDLSHNQFTGPIPSSIGSLQSTFQILLDLSHNLLSGSISPIGNLTSTVEIVVSANYFSGVIPDLSKCLYLSMLDVSQNSLSGEIPGYLAVNPFNLTFLNVSLNNLTGSVDPFTHFTAKSFLPGNEGLCGVILDRPCPAPAPSPESAPFASAETPKSNGRRKITVYAGCAVLVFCLFLIFASWLDREKQRSSRHLRDAVACYARGLEIIRLTVEDLQTATDVFNSSHAIGRGGTSTVYKGLLPFYPFIIAVKKFHDNEDGRQRMLKEAGIMRSVRHRNLLGTLGISSVPRSINVLVLEYMANGTLNQHLHAGEVCELSWDVRLNIAIDVATGMCYLHEDSAQHTTVIHGDLKPANIFLDCDFSAKVGDFGLAKLLADVDSAQRPERRWEGTFGYSPPGDVYSFGVVLLEMVTRRRPTHVVAEQMAGGFDFIHWVRAAFPEKLGGIVDPSLAEDFSSNKDAIELFFRVGLLCSRDNPRERPKMREALEMIKTVARTNPNSATLLPPADLPTIEKLIDDYSYTSFQHAKSWGWINHNFIFDIRDSAEYFESWFSLCRLDMRDSKTLKAMGFETEAVINIRKQTEMKRRARQAKPRGSWMRTVLRALLRKHYYYSRNVNEV